jgi:anthranilate synthase component 1
MTQPLTLAEFQVLAQQAKRIAVFREIPMGSLTPIQSYRLLSKAHGDNGVMLENLHQQESTRYAHLCFDCIASLSLQQGDKQDPMAALRKFQSQFTFATRDSVADLISCAMGLMTYDIVRYFENIPDRHPIDSQLPILLFHFYTLSLTFDHANQSILISKVVAVSDNLEEDFQKAQHTLDDIIQLLVSELPQTDSLQQPTAVAQIEVDVSDADFMHKIEKAKQYIVAGDAFQIVLSRCFKRHYSVTPLEIYQTLCQVSPSPFMFYFPTKARVILGASPERMISVIDRQVKANPIAGTRKRVTDSTDAAITADLLSNEKELAEHMMLVDLARNDVGSVSVPGSVVVSEFLKVKHYSHVSHITSTVTGQLQDKYDAYDAFAAAFPAGTLSGAPKIRAMEIIDELEISRRGMYGGAICRIDAKGNFDSCIAIRMALLQDGTATIRVGAGIVYDSNPAAEAQETYQKAQSMLHAIAEAHGEQHAINHR